MTRSSQLVTTIFPRLLAAAIFLLLAMPAASARAGDDGGMALEFTAADSDYVYTAVAPELNMGNSSFTVETWVWADSSTSYSSERMLVEYGGWETGNYQLTTDNDGNFRGNFYGRSSATGSVATADWTDGQWHHLATVFDNSADTIKTYMDGELMDTTVETEAPDNVDHALFLAARGDTGGGLPGLFSDVTMEEVRIWNVARTETQLRDNMFRELDPATASGLVLYYQLNNTGGGATAVDATGNANGSLSGSPVWVSSGAPIAALDAASSYEPAAIWGGQTDTALDGRQTGLEIADVSFLGTVGDDIVFGHNNAAFANTSDNTGSGGRADVRWARFWQLDVNQPANSGGSVDLIFDISEAGGSGTFDSGGTYYLLRRAAGTNDNFAPVVPDSTIVGGDRIAFRINALSLANSDVTLGAGSGSPTAVQLAGVSSPPAVPSGSFLALVVAGFFLLALTAMALKAARPVR